MNNIKLSLLLHNMKYLNILQTPVTIKALISNKTNQTLATKTVKRFCFLHALERG